MYRPLEWNHIMFREDLFPCPFCASTAQEEQKGNKEREHRISCSDPHCAVGPHTHAEYGLEDAEVAWQLRKERVEMLTKTVAAERYQ